MRGSWKLEVSRQKAQGTSENLLAFCLGLDNSDESLAYMAKQFFRIPARNDIPREQLPDWMRNLNIPKMAMDWELVEAKQQEWMEHWNSFIRNAAP